MDINTALAAILEIVGDQWSGEGLDEILEELYLDSYEEGFSAGYDQGCDDVQSKVNSDKGWDNQARRDAGEFSGRDGDW